MFNNSEEDGEFTLEKDGKIVEGFPTKISDWRVSIYESRELAPLNISYTFLHMIPNSRKDFGVASFKNLLKQFIKVARVEGKKELEKSYLHDSKLFAKNPNLNLVYEGKLNGEGVEATGFDAIQTKVYGEF